MDPKTEEKLNSEVGSISGYLRFLSQVLYKLKLEGILGEMIFSGILIFTLDPGFFVIFECQ